MTTVEMSSALKATLVRAMAADEYVIQAAQVSVRGANDPDLSIEAGLNPQRFIRALMNPRHGVPFEHTSFTFFVEVPIFVVRQWVKHRISSINEMSGRYTKLLPKFYQASSARPMFNAGTKMKPRMEAAPFEVYRLIAESDRGNSQMAWDEYVYRLELGVAEEYARTVLPVSVYTQFYWTLNARSLMNFLERRVEDHDARVPSHPQWEIDFAARQIEEAFKLHMPFSHKAFVEAGRVAP